MPHLALAGWGFSREQLQQCTYALLCSQTRSRPVPGNLMLYIMSTTVIPASAVGIWRVLPVSRGLAIELLETHPWTSAVGHASTAGVITEILGIDVPMNRQTVTPGTGDRFLCFGLNSRPPEGVILDREQLEAIGYSWVYMAYVSPESSTPIEYLDVLEEAIAN